LLPTIGTPVAKVVVAPARAVKLTRISFRRAPLISARRTANDRFNAHCFREAAAHDH
jgi:hypothetical protein